MTRRRDRAEAAASWLERQRPAIANYARNPDAEFFQTAVAELAVASLAVRECRPELAGRLASLTIPFAKIVRSRFPVMPPDAAPAQLAAAAVIGEPVPPVRPASRDPFRVYELAYLRSLGRTAGWTTMATRLLHLVARDPVNTPAYRITHAVFYATDFGSRPAPAPRYVRERLQGRLRAIADASVAVDNVDLLAEAQLALVLLDDQAPAESRWKALDAAQQPGGHVAGPREREASAELCERGLLSEEAATFVFCYHPTLAAMLAYALAGRS
jgi:hypothetical protein